MKKTLFVFICITLLASFFTVSAYANKTAVSIEVKSSAAKGSEVTVTIHVKHAGNTGMHYTEWVWLKINGQEVKRWTYNKTVLPPAGKFVLTYTFTLNEESLIEVQGYCNLHGSKGIVSAKVAVE
jgi:desulfoferrodoxin (superoxide reductase-like protein)